VLGLAAFGTRAFSDSGLSDGIRLLASEKGDGWFVLVLSSQVTCGKPFRISSFAPGASDKKRGGRWGLATSYRLMKRGVSGRILCIKVRSSGCKQVDRSDVSKRCHPVEWGCALRVYRVYADAGIDWEASECGKVRENFGEREHGICGLRGLTFELTGPMRRDGLARAGRMYRVAQAGPRQPAVAGPVVQRGVRPHCGAVAEVVFRRLENRMPEMA
jgi:hypothetical protein